MFRLQITAAKFYLYHLKPCALVLNKVEGKVVEKYIGLFDSVVNLLRNK